MIADKLAAALRETKRMFDGFETLKETRPAVYAVVREALAEYDAERSIERDPDTSSTRH
jgi:hypothetical protein